MFTRYSQGQMSKHSPIVYPLQFLWLSSGKCPSSTSSDSSYVLSEPRRLASFLKKHAHMPRNHHEQIPFSPSLIYKRYYSNRYTLAHAQRSWLIPTCIHNTYLFDLQPSSDTNWTRSLSLPFSSRFILINARLKPASQPTLRLHSHCG
jgi:hypothetical protein